MRSPVLAVAGLAVDVVIRTVASDDRVQCLGAVMALVALAMPLTTLGQDHFSSEDYAAAAWTTVSGCSLDGRRIGGRWLRCEFAVEYRKERFVSLSALPQSLTNTRMLVVTSRHGEWYNGNCTSETLGP